MSKGLDYFLLEGFENDTDVKDTDPSGEGEDGEEEDTSIDASGNDTSIDASGNDTTIDASGNDTSSTDGTMHVILTYENLYLLFWFVSFYFIIYSILAFLFTRNSLGYVYDVIILITIGLMAAAYWFFESDETTKNDAQGAADKFLKFFEDKYNAVYITGTLILLYLVVFLFGIPSDPDTKPRLIVGLETLLFILLVLVLFWKNNNNVKYSRYSRYSCK